MQMSFRILLVVLFVALSCIEGKSRSRKKNHMQLQHLYKHRLGRNRTFWNEGVWSEWSQWTPCSRSCGGGVSTQSRSCIARPPDANTLKNRRRRHFSQNDVTNQCVGLYKRHHLCNLKECPGKQDFRTEQCSSYNSRHFKGKIFVWEPFLSAGNECALTCRPSGMNFYALLNKTVVDGTPCFNPLTATLKPAPPGTKGVCVEGKCKSVNSDGIVGAVDYATSGSHQELCTACLAGCRTVSGLFTRPQLQQGPNLVASIPKGACRVVVAQLKHTRNQLAISYQNGTFIVNGHRDSARQDVIGAGTIFSYKRQSPSSPETITSPGPLSTPADIILFYEHPNHGIKYEYLIPHDMGMDKITAPLQTDLAESHYPRRRSDEEAAPPSVQQDSPVGSKALPALEPPTETRRRYHHHHSSQQRRTRRKVTWRITGKTPCSKPCGGGIQYPVIQCTLALRSAKVVDESYCTHLERPENQTLRCNPQACTTSWYGTWGTCSVSCGIGLQKRRLDCIRDTDGRIEVIEEIECSSLPKPSTTRSCSLPACPQQSNEIPGEERTNWQTGAWSQCSSSCGPGHRTRSVSCPGRCLAESRPAASQSCEGPPCAEERRHNGPWLVSEWSQQCSESCGRGQQTRIALCQPGASCDRSEKPATSRACSSERTCGGQWYSGPWGACSESCGEPSSQTREVLCIGHVRGQPRVLLDMLCSASERPQRERPCSGTCSPRWFTGDWGECESCSSQRREVRCMEWNGVLSSACGDAARPASVRSCSCAIVQPKAEYSKESSNVQPQDEPHIGCSDKLHNCHHAVKARLCQYPYYRTTCCASCSRTVRPET